MRFVYLLLLIFSPLLAQDYIEVKGVITSTETGKAITGVEIILENSSQGTTTDGEGFFKFKVKKRATPTLIFSHIGYVTFSKKVTKLSDILNIKLTPKILTSSSIIVSETRAILHKTPTTFTNKTHDEIKNSYSASDVPMLLGDLPNTYSYSQSGDEIGYSFVKIRGFDQKRINVMVNDVPLNDPEDQEVYWVDMPDLGENVEDIQVQRGAGSSIYGSSSLGGSININSSPLPRNRSISAQYGIGSYGLKKFSLQFNSGLVADKYSFYSRFSQLSNRGFRRNSESDLWSYYFSGVRYDEDMVTQLNIFGGSEVTKPDWYGIPSSILKSDRKYNQSTYKREVDDFLQQHYHLSNEWQISEQLELKNTLYMVTGVGFYEGLKTGKKLRDFGMENFLTNDPGLFGNDSLEYYDSEDDTLITSSGKYTVKKTDLVRQKYVDKTQAGFISHLSIKSNQGRLTLGLAGYTFNSDHFGKVIWAKNMPAKYHPDRKYYSYDGKRTQLSTFVSSTYNISEEMVVLSNFLYERKNAGFEQNEVALFNGDLLNSYNITYNLINSKIGLIQRFNKNSSLYGNISYAQREPTDGELFNTWEGADDLGAKPLFKKSKVKADGSIEWKDPYTKPESVLDFELGVNYLTTWLQSSLNIYWMDYRNEIVPNGALNNDGQPIKGNADKTIHRGVELVFNTHLNENFDILGNFAYSQNYYDKYIQKEMNWDTYEVEGVDLGGNDIAGFPSIIGNIKLTSRYDWFFGALSMQHIGKQYLDNTQNEKRVIDAFTTFNLFTAYDIDTDFAHLPKMRLILKINNLLDKKYETAGYYDAWAAERFYWPAAGRNFYTSLEIEL